MEKKLTEFVTTAYDEYVTEIIPIDEFSENYHSGVLTANEFNDIISSKATVFVDILKEYADNADLPFEIEIASSGFDSAINVFDGDDPVIRAETLTNPVPPVVGFLVQNTLRPTIVRIVGSVVFAVTFFVLIAVLGIVLKATGVVNKIPIVGGVNRFAGAILGLLAALIIIYILSRLCLIFFGNSPGLYAFVDRTLFTKYIFSLLTETNGITEVI
jgi:hypothetical protein